MVITQYIALSTIIRLKLNELHIIMDNQCAGAFNYSDFITLTPDLSRHVRDWNAIFINKTPSPLNILILHRECILSS